MPDPNSVFVNINGTTATVVAAPGATTTLLNPPPPYPLTFIRVLGMDLTCTQTCTITIQSIGGPFPTRTLDIIQGGAQGGVVQRTTDGSGNSGLYDCDPGCALSITVSAGTVTGSIRYTTIGP